MSLVRIALILCISCYASLCLAREQEFQIIAYHDVRDFVRQDIDADQYAISTRNLIQHFTWLRVNGFVPISINDLIRAKQSGTELPDKAVLLTFDDGFKSIYTHVFPLLKLFNYPAVVSIVTGWIDGDAPLPDEYASLGARAFSSWDEIREMQQSGLVEIASHSHSLHSGIVANPQGNRLPAAVTRRYSSNHYESNEEYQSRIRDDLRTSKEIIESRTGRPPRVLTWPYGAYNDLAVGIADELGMPITLTLTSGTNTLANTSALSRHLVLANPDVTQLSTDLLFPDYSPILRVAQVDLDYVFDEDAAQQERNLDELLDRIKRLQISHVFLQAFADPDADGGAQELYFPNRHLPVRADLFNRVAWQLKTRSGVLVYAWLPILSFEGPAVDPSWRALQDKQGEVSVDTESEPRLSVFHPQARRLIAEIYEDLAVHAPLDGILFHDDGRLNEFEDANPVALEAYRQAFGRDFSVDAAHADPELLRAWSEYKTRRIIEFTNELTAVVKQYRPEIRTARNLFSASLLDLRGETYLAQNFASFLEAYDYVALMAMPYFENATSPHRYFEELTRSVGRYEHGFDRTIFELQTVDWNTASPLPADEVADTMRWLQARGVKHLGYYPDDFISDAPALRQLRLGMSLATHPNGEP